jgi:arabinofuranan 3-O-arabinosyltransferase
LSLVPPNSRKNSIGSLSKPYEEWPQRSLGQALWPIAIALFLLKAAQVTRGGLFGLDLGPVWTALRAFLQHHPPYVPDFVYPPSCLLVLAPLGALSFRTAKFVVLAVGEAGLAISCFLTLEALGIRWRSSKGAAALLGTIFLFPVLTSLNYLNANILILPLFAIFIYLAARGRWSWAGILLGLSLAIKPILLPVLALPLLARQWKAAGLALFIPVGLSALALPLTAEGLDYFSRVLPYLLAGERGDLQQFNTTILGLGTMLHAPGLVTVALRLCVLGLMVLAVWRRWQAGGSEALRIVEVSGILVLSSFLASSWGLFYYEILLVPLLVSVFHPDSLLRHWLIWLGVFALSTDGLTHHSLSWETKLLLDQARTTVALLFILVVISILVFKRAAPKSGIRSWQPNSLVSRRATSISPKTTAQALDSHSTTPPDQPNSPHD